jgi:hypothetical protein
MLAMVAAHGVKRLQRDSSYPLCPRCNAANFLGPLMIVGASTAARRPAIFLVAASPDRFAILVLAVTVYPG